MSLDMTKNVAKIPKIFAVARPDWESNKEEWIPNVCSPPSPVVAPVFPASFGDRSPLLRVRDSSQAGRTVSV